MMKGRSRWRKEMKEKEKGKKKRRKKNDDEEEWGSRGRIFENKRDPTISCL